MNYLLIIVNGKGEVGQHNCSTSEEVQKLIQNAMSLRDGVLSLTVIDRVVTGVWPR